MPALELAFQRMYREFAYFVGPYAHGSSQDFLSVSSRAGKRIDIGKVVNIDRYQFQSIAITMEVRNFKFVGIRIQP
jgi:hypothetical protein